MMKQEKTETFEAVVVRNDKGQIDFKATSEKASEMLRTSENARNERNAVFADALSNIFDTHQALKIDQASLAGAVTEWLQTPLSERGKVTAQALEYIQSVVGERGKAEYGSARGKKGGTFRWSDVPEKTEEKSEE